MTNLHIRSSIENSTGYDLPGTGASQNLFLAGPTPSLSFCLCQIPEKNPKN